MGGILSLLVFYLFMYGYEFLSRVFTVRREILYSGSATSQTSFLPFWGIAQGWPSCGRQQGPYGGMCFLLKHLYNYIIVRPKTLSSPVVSNGTLQSVQRHPGLTQHFKVFLTFGHSGAQHWAPECPNVEKLKMVALVDSFLPQSEKVWDWKG